MAVMTPGTTTGYNLQKWAREIEGATYQKLQFIPSIYEGERLYGTLNVRKHARVSGTVLGQSAEGTGLSPSTLAGTPITVTPAGNYIALYWSENEDAQIDFSIDSEGRDEVEQGLAESTEATVLTNVQSLTVILSGAAVDATMLRQAHALLTQNTNGVAIPGGELEVMAIFTVKQMPNLQAIPEVNSAELRGDSENPYVKGIWLKGFGLRLMISTVIANDANGDHNCVYLKRAFIVSWNRRTQIVNVREELQKQLIAYNNLGSSVLHNARAVAVRTTGSALP